MTLPHYLEPYAQQLADYWFGAMPRKRPSRQALQECKLISHRGEHDNQQIRENTIAAFDPVVAAGVWGIEFDVRWTKDLQPVVIHDSDTIRVFGVELAVADVSFIELRQRVPEIPALVEVVAAYGGKAHLMIELKPDKIGEEETKAARLKKALAPLEPGRDYHFLALQPERFSLTPFVNAEAWLLVSETNTAEISQQALSRKLGGICGHYLLLNAQLVSQHRAKGQKIGTGFVTSRFCFYRELNRGIDWIFTNHALKLSDIRDKLLSHD